MNQYFLSLRSWGHMLTFKSFHLMKTSPFYEKKNVISGTNTFIYRSLVKTYMELYNFCVASRLLLFICL